MTQANNNDSSQNAPISIDIASEDVKPREFSISTLANPAKELPSLPILQETTRAHLAKFLVYSFVGTVLAVFITIGIDKFFYYTASNKNDFKDQTGTKVLKI